MMKTIRTLFIFLSISFLIGQNWNNLGTAPMTFRVTVEPYMPPDEIMSIEFGKNGGVEASPANPKYIQTANRRFHVPMKKIGMNQWEVTVDLDTLSYYNGGATLSESMFSYHYNRNHSMPAMQDREPLKSEHSPSGAFLLYHY